MSTSPVMSITDEMVAELEALAISVQGWNMTAFFQEPDAFEVEADWEWHVGAIDEDGNKYPLLHVNASQYDSDDSEKIARYYAACSRDTILALLAERKELIKDRERLDWLAAPDNTTGNVQLPIKCVTENVHSLRAAIDAARVEV